MRTAGNRPGLKKGDYRGAGPPPVCACNVYMTGAGTRRMETAGKASGRGGGSLAAAAAEGHGHILSMAERLSADLDNDRPYNADIERRIAECEAGRPIGKTYAAEEYLRHLEREHGIGAVESPE